MSRGNKVVAILRVPERRARFVLFYEGRAARRMFARAGVRRPVTRVDRVKSKLYVWLMPYATYAAPDSSTLLEAGWFIGFD